MTHLYPRSQIDIYIQILQADGGLFVCLFVFDPHQQSQPQPQPKMTGIQAACINAATLALIDAGIPMKDYVTAVSAGCIGGKPLLDINYLEESARGPELTVAILPKSKKITTLEMESRVHADIFEGVLALAIEGCCAIEGILDKVALLLLLSPRINGAHSLSSFFFRTPHKNRWCVRGQKNWLFLEEFETLPSLLLKETHKIIFKAYLSAMDTSPPTSATPSTPNLPHFVSIHSAHKFEWQLRSPPPPPPSLFWIGQDTF